MRKKPAFLRRLIALRIVVTLGYCVVGGWLLWPLTVRGWPLATFVWIAVMLAALILLAWGGFGVRPTMLLRLLRADPDELARAIRGHGHPKSAETLSLIEDILALALFSGAIVSSALTPVQLRHHLLTAGLAVLNGTSQWVKYRLWRAWDDSRAPNKPVDRCPTRQRNEESSAELE